MSDDGEARQTGDTTKRELPSDAKAIPSKPAPGNDAAKKELDNAEKELSRFERYTLRLAWAGFVVAILTGVVFYLQFREMGKQTSTLNQQARQAAIDSVEAEKRVERQLKIAGQQVDVASQSMKLGERAWVGLSNVEKADTVAIGTKFGASMDINNFGHSPAHDAYSSVRVRIFCDQFPVNPPYDLPEVQPYKHSHITLMPGEHVNTNRTELDHPLTVDEMNSLLTPSNCSLYFYGRLQYCDIFGTFHYIHRCGQWMPGTPHRFIACNAYNDGDGDHPNQKPVSCKLSALSRLLASCISSPQALGLRRQDNIQSFSELAPPHIGAVFYSASNGAVIWPDGFRRYGGFSTDSRYSSRLPSIALIAFATRSPSSSFRVFQRN